MALTVVSSSHTYPYCLLVTHTSDSLANRRPHQLPCTEAGRHSKSVEGPGKSLLPCRKPLCPNHAAKLTLVALISIPSLLRVIRSWYPTRPVGNKLGLLLIKENEKRIFVCIRSAQSGVQSALARVYTYSRH